MSEGEQAQWDKAKPWIWAAKEAMFKGHGPNLDFRRDLSVDSMTWEADCGQLVGTVRGALWRGACASAPLLVGRGVVLPFRARPWMKGNKKGTPWDPFFVERLCDYRRSMPLWRRSELTVNFLRPLRRRALKTLRPLAVAMRLRKPCLLRRFRTEG